MKKITIKTILLITTISFLMLELSQNTLAVFCGPSPSLADQYRTANAVFIGELTEVERDESPSIHFKVKKSWKGPEAGSIFIATIDGLSLSYMSLSIIKEEYLVITQASQIDICSGMKHISQVSNSEIRKLYLIDIFTPFYREVIIGSLAILGSSYLVYRYYKSKKSKVVFTLRKPTKK